MSPQLLAGVAVASHQWPSGLRRNGAGEQPTGRRIREASRGQQGRSAGGLLTWDGQPAGSDHNQELVGVLSVGRPLAGLLPPLAGLPVFRFGSIGASRGPTLPVWRLAKDVYLSLSGRRFWPLLIGRSGKVGSLCTLGLLALSAVSRPPSTVRHPELAANVWPPENTGPPGT